MTRVKPSDFHSDKVVEDIENGYVYYPDIDRKILADKALYTNLNIIKRGVRYDRDAVICVVGDPGSGKSVLTLQMAKFVDPTFDIDRIYFDGEKLIRKISSPDVPKYTAFVYDEAREGLNARRSQSRINVFITDCLAEIRQKNLFIFIVLPDFWDLDSNIAKKRSRYLLHVKEIADPDAGPNQDPWRRGFFGFFNRKDKNRLYVLGKKNFYEMDCYPPSFVGTFANQYVVDEEEYRRRKSDALRTNRKLDEEDTGAVLSVRLTTFRRKALKILVQNFPEKPNVFWANVFSVDPATITTDMKTINSETVSNTLT